MVEASEMTDEQLNEQAQVTDTEPEVNSEADSAAPAGTRTATEPGDISSHPQFKGTLRDLQNERRQRQAYEAKVAEYEARLAEFEKAGKPAETKETPEDDDAEQLVDRKFFKTEVRQAIKELREQERAEEAAAAAKRQKAEFEQHLVQCEEAARQKYSTEKAGDGLDFDTVIQEGRENLTPGDWAAIQAAKDPAEEAYRRCIRLSDELHERFLNRKTVKTNSTLLNNFQRGKAPKGGGGSGGGNLDVSRLSDAELAKLAAAEAG